MTAVALRLALASALAAPAAASAAPRQVPAGWIGVAGIDVVTDRGMPLDPQLDAIAASGAEALRVPIYWPALEPFGPDVTDFRATDAIVLGAAKRGIRVVAVVLDAPAWAALAPGVQGSPPKDSAAYGDFVARLARRYGESGTLWAEHRGSRKVAIRDWQVWNEPNLSTRWSVQPFAASYVKLLRATRKALKTVDARGRIMLAGLPNSSWGDLGRVYRAGGRGTFDIAAVHPYTSLVKNVVKIVELNRDAMRRYGDAATPIALTEVSWSSGKGRVKPSRGFEPLTEGGQATRLADVLTALAKVRARYRIANVFWFTWLSPAPGSPNAFDYSGLRRLDAGGRVVDKPALDAFRTAARKLNGCAKEAASVRCR